MWGHTSQQSRLGLFQDADFAGALEDSKSVTEWNLLHVQAANAGGTWRTQPQSCGCKFAARNLCFPRTRKCRLREQARIRIPWAPRDLRRVSGVPTLLAREPRCANVENGWRVRHSMRQGGSRHGRRSGTQLFFRFEKEFRIQRECRQELFTKNWGYLKACRTDSRSTKQFREYSWNTACGPQYFFAWGEGSNPACSSEHVLPMRSKKYWPRFKTSSWVRTRKNGSVCTVSWSGSGGRVFCCTQIDGKCACLFGVSAVYWWEVTHHILHHQEFGNKTESPISFHFQNTVKCTALMVSRLCPSERLPINNSALAWGARSNPTYPSEQGRPRETANTFHDTK